MAHWQKTKVDVFKNTTIDQTFQIRKDKPIFAFPAQRKNIKSSFKFKAESKQVNFALNLFKIT